MKNYVLYDIDGEIRISGIASDSDFDNLAETGLTKLEGIGQNSTHYVSNNKIVEYTVTQKITKASKPTYISKWSNITFSWSDSRSIPQIRKAKLASVLQERTKRLLAPISFRGKQVPITNEDIGMINNISLYISMNGSLPPNWQGFWISSDGIRVAIPDVTAWKSFYSVITEQAISVINRYDQLRTEIMAASTKNSISAITW